MSYFELFRLQLELKYALKRIVRGLGAQNVDSKVGFYCTLVALLSCVENIDVSMILECVKESLKSSGGNSKSVSYPPSKSMFNCRLLITFLKYNFIIIFRSKLQFFALNKNIEHK